jgi:L-gulonolactone oxidase
MGQQRNDPLPSIEKANRRGQLAQAISAENHAIKPHRPQEMMDSRNSRSSSRISNWAGQFSCRPRCIHHASNRTEVQVALEKAAAAGRRLRVFGAGRSPSDIAMSDQDLLIIDGMNRIIAVNAASGRVLVEAGARLCDITEAVAPHGLAFPVLGSISEQSIAGAIATATHGTGIGVGCLSSLVEEIEMVTPDGEIMRLSADRNANIFDALRCGLGTIGVITKLTLKLVPAFDLEVVEQEAPLETILSQLPERLKLDHYRFWYLPHADRAWEWKATRTQPSSGQLPPRRSLAAWLRNRVLGGHVYEAMLYLCSFVPALLPAINRCYCNIFLRKPRSSRDRSDRQFNFDCLFKQHVNEWAIPVERTAEALRGLRGLIADRGFRVHLPIEVRFVKGDDVWLSPSYGRDSCYIGIIAYIPFGRKTTNHDAYFAAFEALMAGLDGRPHWAKRFGPGADWLSQRYPRWSDFQRIRRQLDPDARLTNSYTDRVLGPVIFEPSSGAEQSCQSMSQ